MKDPAKRTKVVLRHLPPAITQPVLMEQIDSRFAGRYKCFFFRPGKSSQKHQLFSRAYIDFEKPEDVVEFAEFFDGHVFVNEKGAQFKTLVEYAPSQRVPKLSRKDVRDGTIFKDPEYLEFLEFVGRPVENLPSAEIQLERREAERSGAAKETIVVTPLMEFVRQKRACRSGCQKPSSNGKSNRRSTGVTSGPVPSKRSSEKRRVSTSIYVLRDTSKSGNGKDKSTSILLQRRGKQRHFDKAVPILATRAEFLEDETGSGQSGTLTCPTGAVDTGKKKLVLLKGKDREALNPSGDTPQLQTVASTRHSASTSFKHRASGKINRSILSKEARQNQSHSEQQTRLSNLEKDKRPPRPPNSHVVAKGQVATNSLNAVAVDIDMKGSLYDKIVLNDVHCASERHDRRTRKKDRLDRVWTPLLRSDGINASDDNLSSSSLTVGGPQYFLEGMPISTRGSITSRSYDEDSGNQHSSSGLGIVSKIQDTSSSQGEIKNEMHCASRNETRALGGGRGRLPLVESSSHRHVGRCGPSHESREADGSLTYSEAKTSKRGPTGFGSHEKQVWVQKSGSGS